MIGYYLHKFLTMEYVMRLNGILNSDWRYKIVNDSPGAYYSEFIIYFLTSFFVMIVIMWMIERVTILPTNRNRLATIIALATTIGFSGQSYDLHIIAANLIAVILMSVHLLVVKFLLKKDK